MKGSESILLTNLLVSFTVKYFVSREEILSKKIVSGSSSGSIVEYSFVVNGLKDIYTAHHNCLGHMLIYKIYYKVCYKEMN